MNHLKTKRDELAKAYKPHKMRKFCYIDGFDQAVELLGPEIEKLVTSLRKDISEIEIGNDPEILDYHLSRSQIALKQWKQFIEGNA